MSQSFTINSEFTLAAAQAELAKQWTDKKWLQISFNYDKTRSKLQNSALHVYCEMLAKSMNDAGYQFVIIINTKETECDWNMQRVKDFMWRPIQEALKKEKSTAKVSTKDYPEIYETLNRHTATRLGISIQWPCKEDKAA